MDSGFQGLEFHVVARVGGLGPSSFDLRVRLKKRFVPDRPRVCSNVSPLNPKP